MQENTSSLPVGCVVMAAGNARRFGENKLAAQVDGKTLIQRALDAIPADMLSAVAVVTQYPQVERLAHAAGFTALKNEHPDWGISHTIKLGTQHLAAHCGAIMYLVSDQPLLRRESVAAALVLYRENPDKIVALSHDGVRGNPCIFPARFFDELMALREDHGGSTVIRRHEEALLLCEVEARQLTDVDTKDALAALKEDI